MQLTKIDFLWLRATTPDERMQEENCKNESGGNYKHQAKDWKENKRWAVSLSPSFARRVPRANYNLPVFCKVQHFKNSCGGQFKAGLSSWRPTGRMHHTPWLRKGNKRHDMSQYIAWLHQVWHSWFKANQHCFLLSLLTLANGSGSLQNGNWISVIMWKWASLPFPLNMLFKKKKTQMKSFYIYKALEVYNCFIWNIFNHKNKWHIYFLPSPQ